MGKRYIKTIINVLDSVLHRIDVFVDWGGNYVEKMVRRLRKQNTGKLLLMGLVALFLVAGGIVIWIASFELPNLNNFDERRIAQSTKIYDRTGGVVLFDVHGEVTRTVVPLDQINDHVKWATIAIEDANFYNHNGIEPKAILRAILINLKDGDLLGGQGGSTITQQVIKNSLLTSDKKISRKVKEWVLAPRLESILTKDEILEVYLNEVPYGGTVYGVQEASRRFFGKDAKDITLAESAYLAALPQAPSRYSPYGNNLDLLEARKNRVLSEMLSNEFITQEQYDQAINEVVTFQKPENFGIKAAHFVFWIREQLEEKYGAEAVESGGLKVVTTLDWKLQEPTEEIVKRFALENATTFNAENAAAVVIDPNTGQVLTMVGSRDYFDEEIDGNFNIATAERQPGSAFKPFVYAEAFNKGYRPETVVFDLPTEFSTTCSSGGECYNPQNYDNIFRGPMSLRDALAQSVNIPAVKTLYLAGIRDSLELARSMGVSTLTNVNQYGLTLVLGGGEVRPIDMATAYGVFATEGVRHNTVGILRVEDKDGKVLEEYKDEATRVLPEQTARLISDVLSDNVARAPAFGSNSFLNIPGADVAVKTGTTNDYRDAWIVGYTPNISLASWAGNNDNRSMEKKVAGFIVAPMWHEIMKKAIELYPAGNFNDPAPMDPNTKPVIAGIWNHEGGVHSILHWVDKDNPLGAPPANPYSDAQYAMWESSVQAWTGNQGFGTGLNTGDTRESANPLQIVNPQNGDSFLKDTTVYVAITTTGTPVKSGEVFINNDKIGDIDTTSNSFSFVPDDINRIKSSNNRLKVVIEDTTGSIFEDSVTFDVQK
jgi:1A family penicillin-binding protein